MPAKSEQDELYQSLWEQWPENSRMLLSAVERERCLTLQGLLVRVVWKQLKKKKKNISLSHYRERNEHRQQAGEERFDLLFAKVSGLCSPHEPYGAGWAVVLLEEAGPLPLPVTPQPWDLLLLLDPITSGSGAHMASVLW